MSIDAKDKTHVANLRGAGNKAQLLMLDLFCSAGGCTVGYQRAGFTVIGVDIKPQPRYLGSYFIQANALSCDYEFMEMFDIIHASPPCQQYSVGSAVARNNGKVYPDLIHPTRVMLVSAGKPYIMENVRPAPMRPDICLDGTMFDLGVIRHRIFETNIPNMPTYPRPSQIEGSVIDGDYVTVAGEGGNGSALKADWEKAMGIDWMTRNELREAIPPAYTEWIGTQALLRIQDGIEALEAAPPQRIVSEPIPDELIPFGVNLKLAGF